MADDISFSDYLAIRNVANEWAASYDTKDWARLEACLAPSGGLTLDFSGLTGAVHERLDPRGYREVIEGLIGDPRLKTQHLLGGSKWERLPPTEGGEEVVRVEHQARVRHQLYAGGGEGSAGEAEEVVVAQGDAFGGSTHTYRKVGGAWKLAGAKAVFLFAEPGFFDTMKGPEPEEGKST